MLEMAVTERFKKRAIANAKLLAHLLLRRMVSVKVMPIVIGELLLYSDNPFLRPPSCKIDCVLALFLECGYTLEDGLKKSGRTQQLDIIFEKLLFLQSGKDKGGRPLLKKGRQTAIANLLDLRKKGWKREISKRAWRWNREGLVDSGDVVYVEEVVGARPEY